MENNRMIAEFMKNDAVNSPHLRTEKELEDTYNYSWAWLMPVVEKIQGLAYYERDPADVYNWNIPYIRTLGNNMCRINGMQLKHGETLIEAVYKSVVEFIKWYNSQRDGVVLNTNAFTDHDQESKPSTRENDF